MRKIALSLAGAAAALGLAAPAAAQFYPAYVPPVHGYAYSPAVAQGMELRVANIRARVRDLHMRGAISWSKARSLDSQAASLQRSIRASAWNGVNPYERANLERRIAKLELRVQTAAYRPRHYRRYAGWRY
jgi:hypothetical protein